MTNLEQHCETLKTIIDHLDPKRDEVAMCHLQDALDAMHATMGGKNTRYARSGTIVRGVVWGQQQIAVKR